MSFFRNREGHDGDKGEVKTPKNQIMQKPETQADKAKLDRYQDKTPEERKKINDTQSKIASEHDKLEKPKNSNDGNANKGQRERERGHTTDMER